MSDSDDLVGKLLLGKLEVVRRLGGGGMGIVYEVEHRLTGHRRALKVVKPQYAERPRFMKRLLREAKVAGTLGSDYVVETYDAGRLEDGSAYVLMELLEGQTLYDVIQDHGTVEPRRLGAIMVQITEGIGAAHDAGIVHRDLKPENVFLIEEDGEERVKILDFGVSKFDAPEGAPSRLTAEGTLVGTPYYMSPEQAGGREIDARSDVYALGVMMYEALVGRLPFEAASVGELFIKIGSGQYVPLDVRRPDLDPRWAELVHRAFHRDPAQRHPSVEALRRDLLPLARSRTAARAKTISDGVRRTLDYGAVSLPKPAPIPDAPAAGPLPAETLAAEPDAPPPAGEPTAAADEGEPPRSPERAPAADEPPTVEEAAPPSRSLGPWAWALAGAAAMFAIALPLSTWLSSDDPPEPPPVAAHEPTEPEPGEPTPADPEPEVEDEAPVGDEAPVALTDPPDAGAPRAEPSQGHAATRATAAGLDPNPYR